MIDFEKFWDPWPRKVNRKTAEKAWVKLPHAQQMAAIADVEKRNRMNAWPSNPKMVTHASTYLNQERWTDEWENELKAERNQDKPNSGAYIPPPREPERKIHWAERMMNRLWVNYCLIAGGLQDPGKAVQVKRTVMIEAVPAYEEDIEAERILPNTAAFEIGELFLTRLDHAYSRNLKPRVIATARRRAA